VARSATVRVTANFEANLGEIRAFWIEADAPVAYDELIDELDATVIAHLERHLEMGRPFLSRSALSIEAQDRIARLSSRAGSKSLRDYLAGDYLILYTAAEGTAYLLAIKHHRQLSFAFDQHWP